MNGDATRARRRIGAALSQLYGYFGLQDLEAVAVFGPPEACVKSLREVAEAGAEMILNPLFDEADQLERLAPEAVPELS